MPFRIDRCSLRQLDPVEGLGKVDDSFARDRLARAGGAAQPGCQVECAAAIAPFDGHRLTGVEAIPTASGALGSAAVSSAKTAWSSVAARSAARDEVKTAIASSPRSSTT